MTNLNYKINWRSTNYEINCLDFTSDEIAVSPSLISFNKGSTTGGGSLVLGLLQFWKKLART